MWGIFGIFYKLAEVTEVITTPLPSPPPPKTPNSPNLQKLPNSPNSRSIQKLQKLSLPFGPPRGLKGVFCPLKTQPQIWNLNLKTGVGWHPLGVRWAPSGLTPHNNEKSVFTNEFWYKCNVFFRVFFFTPRESLFFGRFFIEFCSFLENHPPINPQFWGWDFRSEVEFSESVAHQYYVFFHYWGGRGAPW